MNNYDDSIQETFYQLLITLAREEEMRNRLLPELGEYFHSLFDEFQEIDYPAIFSISYDEDLIREDLELLLQILVEIEKQLYSEEEKRIIQKMRRHFLLSFEQKIRVKVESEETLSRVQSELAAVKIYLEETQEVLSFLQEDSTKIYSQFVTILGIFTAIVVSVFGGLSIVSGVFDKINETPMWKIILTGSTVSIFVLCLLFLLTRWISTIVHRSFGFENERSLMQVISNNGAFASGIFIFCYLIIAAVVFSSKDATNSLKELMNVWDAFPVLILLVLPILAGAAVLIKTIDLRKYKK